MSNLIRTLIALGICWALCVPAFGQEARPSIFTAEEPLHIDLSFDYKAFIKSKDDPEPVYQPAELTVWLDSLRTQKGPIRIRARGNFRRDYCDFPPIKLNLKPNRFTDSTLAQLGKVKLVTLCRHTPSFQQYIYGEYLAYKAYQLLTPMSFGVRLVEITYSDSKGKKKPFTHYGFIIEDVDDVAARNNCFEFEPVYMDSRYLEPQQFLIMAFFDYMIGNTDWYVTNLHNLKLLKSLDFSNEWIYPVPYDFDYSGIVDARYAVPPDRLGIQNVRQRYFQGYCPDDAELNTAIAYFKTYEDELFELYANCPWLNSAYRAEATDYLVDFFALLDQPQRLRRQLRQTCRKTQSVSE